MPQDTKNQFAQVFVGSSRSGASGIAEFNSLLSVQIGISSTEQSLPLSIPNPRLVSKGKHL